MANWFEQNAPPSTAPPPPPSGNWFTQNAPPAAAAPAPPSAIERTVRTAGEDVGAPQFLDILRMRAPGTPAEMEQRRQRGMEAITQLATGIAHEPERIWGELSAIGEGFVDQKQTTKDTIYHTMGLVPGIGPIAQSFLRDFWAEKYPEAAGHVLGLAAMHYGAKAPEVAGGALQAGGEAIGDAAATVRRAPGAVIDMAGGVSPAAREAVGVFSPRAKHILDVAARIKKAKDAYNAAAGPVATPPVAVEPITPEVIPPERQLPAGPLVTPAPADASFVRSVPAEYPPIPLNRRITQGDIIPPAPADTSYVRAVPAEYPPVGEVPAATEAFNRAPVVNEPPIAAPAATAEVSATAEDLRSAMGLQPGEMEAPAAAPEDTAAAAIARQRNANALIKAISPAGVSSDLAANIPQETWNQIAELAKLPPPDAETIQTVIKTVAAQEGRSAPAPTPAAAAPAPDTPAPAPNAPPANAAEELARMMPGYEPPAPEQGPATAIGGRKSRRTDAQRPSPRTSDSAPYHRRSGYQHPMFLEQVAQQIKLNRPAPGEPEAILARVRELRGQTAEQPPAAAAPPPEEAPARFEQEQRAAEVEHAQSLEDRFRSIVADLRATAGDKAEQIIREQLPSRYPGWVGTVPTEEVHADPVRFQYKMDVGQGGAGSKLKKVETWNPDMAGTIQVWKDPANGKTYVVNGHHRLELAKRLGVQDIKVDYLHAADATEARVKGALTNIAEGNGSIMDAARVFRDTGMTPAQVHAEGIAIDGRVARPGLAISKLHPTLFQAVLSGDMPEARGAILGRTAAARPARHVQDDRTGGTAIGRNEGFRRRRNGADE